MTYYYFGDNFFFRQCTWCCFRHFQNSIKNVLEVSIVTYCTSFFCYAIVQLRPLKSQTGKI
jgi:hypothetical protein